MMVFQHSTLLRQALKQFSHVKPTALRTQQLSSLVAVSGDQVRNPGILSRHITKRWKSSNATSLSAEECGNMIAQRDDTHSSRVTPNSEGSTTEAEVETRDEPAYEITFTCKPCSGRSTHKISKQGYHKGTILITCPSCKNRHLICDNLKIFEDQKTNIEDILKKKGELIKRGTIGAGGDLEFWDNGTTTPRTGPQRDIDVEPVPVSGSDR